MKSSRLWFWSKIVCLLILVAVPGQLMAAAAKKTNRVIIYPGPDDTAAQWVKDGASNIQDYGGYWLAEVDDAHLASLKHLHKNLVQDANRYNKIELSETNFDVTVGQPAVPAALMESHTDSKLLRIVQFKGPIKPEWLAQLKAIDKLRLINYVPHNAYLVSVSRESESQLQALTATNGPVQWVGIYHPLYKLPKNLRESSGIVEVKISVINDETVTATLAAVQRYAVGPVQAHRLAVGDVLVRMKTDAGDLAALAQLPGVVWLERAMPVHKQDEVQGLVLACRTNAPGGGPIFPVDRYLDFLTNTVGVSQNMADYPVLDITDTGIDTLTPYCLGIPPPLITWHPAFNFPSVAVSPDLSCCEYAAGTQFHKVYDFVGADDGSRDSEGLAHGTIVASVACGYDDLPDELIHCFTQTFSTNDVTNIVFVANCNTDQVISCVNNVCSTNFVVASCIQTSVTVVVVCKVVKDSLLAPPPWYLSRTDFSGYQLGMGISPYGRFGASDYTVAATNAEDVALNAYLIGLARLSNNSWGEVLVVGENDGLYGDLSQSYDALTRDAVTTGSTISNSLSPKNQEMLFIFAGGNNNGVDPVGGFGDVLTTPPATAKNVISVGATTLGHPAGNTFGISFFSSFGPTSDLRFKPDVVAPGEGISGATSQASYGHEECGGCDPNNPEPFACEKGFLTEPVVETLYGQFTSAQPGFSLYDGTSFSAPAVSGGAQLLYWYISNRLFMLPPSPALEKAYIMNSARYLPITDKFGAADKLPSIAQGMGMMDLSRMFDTVPRVLRDESTPRAVDVALYATNVVAQQTFFSAAGQSYEVSGQIADASQPFRVTLVWTDPPGTPGNGPQLVNNLDLQVTINGQTYFGNNFGTQYSTAQNPIPDTINNVESVFLPAGTTGTWSVVVRAVSLGGDGVPHIGTGTDQDYALVVYNATNPSDVPNLTTNDSCQTALPLTTFPVSFTNNLAVGVYHNTQPSPTAGRGGDEEFFAIPYPTPGTVFNADTIGSNFGLKGTVLSVWKGSCGGLIEVTSSRNPLNANQSAVTWTVTDTNIYYIVAEGFQNSHGQLVLNVKATPPPFGFSTSLVDFGTNYVGLVTNITVTLANSTGNNALISSVSIGGPNAGDFDEFDNCADKFLLPGGTCQLTLSFEPSAPGVRNALLIVNDNITGSPHTLPLTGFGLAQVPLFCGGSAVGLSFGSVAIGYAAPVQTIVITNCGTANMIITNEVLTGSAAADYVIAPDGCSGQTLVPGATCTLGVSFVPTTSGVRVATLVVNDNSPASTAKSITLTGTGTVPVPSFCESAGGLGFGNVSLGTTGSIQSLIVSNCGTAVLNLSSISISGSGASEYFIVSNPCIGIPIPIGGTCSIALAFAPTVIGSASAVLTITDNAPGNPHTFSLTGVGTGSLPDAQIAKKPQEKQFVGKNLYTPPLPISAQSVQQNGGRNKVTTFYIRCQNDGNAPDSYTVLGGGDVAGTYTVQYFLGTDYKDGVDITAAIEAGTYTTANLEAGAILGDATMIVMRVTSTKTAVSGLYTIPVQFRSTSNLSKEDSVGAVIKIH